MALVDIEGGEKGEELPPGCYEPKPERCSPPGPAGKTHDVCAVAGPHGGGGNLRVPIKFGEVEIEAVTDSGAGVACLGEEMARHLGVLRDPEQPMM